MAITVDQCDAYLAKIVDERLTLSSYRHHLKISRSVNGGVVSVFCRGQIDGVDHHCGIEIPLYLSWESITGRLDYFVAGVKRGLSKSLARRPKNVGT